MAPDLAALGSPPASLAVHYDLPQEFFRLWLGSDLVYSCALWDGADPDDTLERAQVRKVDLFARALQPQGRRMLDVGCGWGALAERFVRAHGAASVTALNLSRAQVDHARGRGVAGVDVRLESWVDHRPEEAYAGITCIEATEHFASDALTAEEKVEVYQAFFDRCASWLEPGGRVGLQLICLDQVGHAGSRAGRGPLSELIRTRVFPAAMPSSLSEMVLGWETNFRLVSLAVHPDHYVRTARAWHERARDRRQAAEALVGEDVYRDFVRYFAAAEILFRLGEHTLYRVVLERRERPKAWASPLRPPSVPGALVEGAAGFGASPAAVRAHYDVSNDFYRVWLGPSMVYTSGMWAGVGAGEPHAGPAKSAREAAIDVADACRRKVGFFADAVLPAGSGRILDVGCGWGGPLRILQAMAPVNAVGLTLSPAQAQYLRDGPIERTEIRLEGWEEHQPAEPYDAILSFGAFEHFARDGLPRAQRIEVYRSFFARCHAWLRPGGRIGLESIAHDDAAEASGVAGRGPMADLILDLFPESLAPHLCELVCGFEPWFCLEVLRSDADDFVRTFRAWLAALRSREPEARSIVGDDTYRRFSRYLAATEMQFRLGAITNYRLVLRRRPAIKR